MRTTNKILSIILAILMVISIIPITASAATYEGTCGDNVTWTYDSSTYTLTISGTGDMYDYKYNNRPWESYKNNIMQVVISDEVTSIGMYAFYYLTKTTSITIPDSVTVIKKSAFANCYKLESVTIPDSVAIIGEQAFYACKILTSVVIPKSVTTIEKNAFYLCDNLTSITVDNNSQHFSSDEYGVLFNKDKTTLIKYPSSNCETRYSIPDSVTEICQYAFDDCFNLKSVTIPIGVITLAKYSFHYQNYNLILYYNGTEKQWNSLINNNSITNYITRYTVHCLDKTLYPSGACENNLIWIYDNSTGTLTISGAGEMYNYEFDENSGFGFRPWEAFIYAIEHIIIEEGVTSIGTCAFMDCQNLIDVNLSDSITSIGEETFYFCPNLTDVYYTGTKEQWKAISIGGSNDPLLKATIHYNYHVHEYNPILTPPTCTERGYTTYTCECGDSYVDDYVDALGHTEEIIPAVAPTCIETGITEGAKCSVCGETLTEQKELPANGHTPANAVEENYVAPTCTENGNKDVVVYCSVCDEEISRTTETINATGHADNDGDGYCDADNELLDPSVECDHTCHKGGIFGFIWKIINFFNKLFGLNKTCSCGVAHY